MAQPNRKRKRQPQTPLQALLAEVGVTEAQLRAILRDGAEEAERLIPKFIEQSTTGGRVRASQIAIAQREIRAMLDALWGDLGAAVRQGVGSAVLSAAQGEDILLRFMNEAATDTMRAAFTEQARGNIANILAKAANNIPLSLQVYRTQTLANGEVNRRVQRGLLLGHSAQRIADDVRDLIRPDVPGGVSYAAMRLARTELNNAFRTSQELRYRDEPWCKGMKWNLSGSHPKRDECNDYAEADEHGLGAGVYPFGHVPRGHPNCLCHLTPHQEDEEDFIEAFLAGDYSEFIDETAYTHAPPGMLPC